MKTNIFYLIFISITFTAFFSLPANAEQAIDQTLTLTLPFGERAGTYTGDIQNGLPNGTGKFESQNPEGLM